MCPKEAAAWEQRSGHAVRAFWRNPRYRRFPLGSYCNSQYKSDFPAPAVGFAPAYIPIDTDRRATLPNRREQARRRTRAGYSRPTALPDRGRAGSAPDGSADIFPSFPAPSAPPRYQIPWLRPYGRSSPDGGSAFRSFAQSGQAGDLDEAGGFADAP